MLVRVTEPAQVGHDDVKPGKPGHHLPVVIAPTRPAVQQQHRRPIPGPVVGEPESVFLVAHMHAANLPAGAAEVRVLIPVRAISMRFCFPEMASGRTAALGPTRW